MSHNRNLATRRDDPGREVPAGPGLAPGKRQRSAGLQVSRTPAALLPPAERMRAGLDEVGAALAGLEHHVDLLAGAIIAADFEGALVEAAAVRHALARVDRTLAAADPLAAEVPSAAGQLVVARAERAALAAAAAPLLAAAPEAGPAGELENAAFGSDQVRTAALEARSRRSSDWLAGLAEPDPGSPEEEKLLAHEVAHTVGQAGSVTTPQTKLDTSSPHDASEDQRHGLRRSESMAGGSAGSAARLRSPTAEDDDLATRIRSSLARGLVARALWSPLLRWKLPNRQAPTRSEMVSAVYDALSVTVSNDGKVRTELVVPEGVLGTEDFTLADALEEGAAWAFQEAVELLVGMISELAAKWVGIGLELLLSPTELGRDDVTHYSPAEIVGIVAHALTWSPPPVPTIGPAR